MHHFGNGRKFRTSIDFFVEKEPLGNAGALFMLKEKLGDEDFLLLNADAVFDVNFNRMVTFHSSKFSSIRQWINHCWRKRRSRKVVGERG